MNFGRNLLSDSHNKKNGKQLIFYLIKIIWKERNEIKLNSPTTVNIHNFSLSKLHVVMHGFVKKD